MTYLSWNKPSIDFYFSLGAEENDWNVFHLTGEELENLANELYNNSLKKRV